MNLIEANTTEKKYLTRAEVAKLLRRSTRSVDLYVKQGLLKPLRFRNKTKAIGFALEDVNKLLVNE